jgi:mono/diheme cytochrome c family protein
MPLLFLIIAALGAAFALPIQADERRAKVNYMLHCQGCHTPDGSGLSERGVPSLKNFMGKFLKVEGGREFLIQVPGAAQSTLNSEQLAEMTNWMLTSFDPQSVQDGFQRYSAQEVQRLRQYKLVKVTETRANLLNHINNKNRLQEHQ